MKPPKDKNTYCIYDVKLNELKLALNLWRSNSLIHVTLFNCVIIIVEMYVAMMDNAKHHVWYIRVSLSCGRLCNVSKM